MERVNGSRACNMNVRMHIFMSQDTPSLHCTIKGPEFYKIKQDHRKSLQLRLPSIYHSFWRIKNLWNFFLTPPHLRCLFSGVKLGCQKILTPKVRVSKIFGVLKIQIEPN